VNGLILSLFRKGMISYDFLRGIKIVYISDLKKIIFDWNRGSWIRNRRLGDMCQFDSLTHEAIGQNLLIKSL